MLKRSLLVLGLVGLLTAGAGAESLVSYVSFDDDTPGDPGIEVAEGGSATIEVWLLPVSGPETHFGAGGFAYDGNAPEGEGTIVEAGYTLSDHAWDPETFGNPNLWFAADDLPSPQAVGFNPPGAEIGEGLLLATMTVTGTVGDAVYTQAANPEEFFTGFLDPITLAEGSGSFDIHVTPEPATVALMLLGGLSVLRRRQ